MAYPDLPATRVRTLTLWSALSAAKVLLGMVYLHGGGNLAYTYPYSCNAGWRRVFRALDRTPGVAADQRGL